MVTNTLRVATANASRADEPQSNRQLASITHFISMGSGLPHPDTTNIAACQEPRIPRLLPASTTSPPTPPSPPAPTGAPGDPDDDGGNTPELVRLYYRYLSQPTKDRL